MRVPAPSPQRVGRVTALLGLGPATSRTGVVLEVTAEETQTRDIAYVPFRIEIKKEDLHTWLTPHTTTILDIEMLRIPSANVFGVYRH
jgi:hypothetical protein